MDRQEKSKECLSIYCVMRGALAVKGRTLFESLAERLKNSPHHVRQERVLFVF
jgi:hypothetical protein